MIWILGVGVLGGVYAFYKVASKKKQRREAGSSLEASRRAWSAGDRKEALVRLADALFVPSGGKYVASDARIICDALALFDEVLAAYGIAARAFRGDALESMTSGLASGAPSIAEPASLAAVRRFLRGAKGAPHKVFSEAISFHKGPLVHHLGPSPLGEPTTDESELVNRVGRATLFGDSAEARQMIDRALPTARPHLAVSLLNQRAGCFWKEGAFMAALDDYMHCARIEPGNVMHYMNVVETLGTLGRVPEAREWTLRAFGATRDNVDLAQVTWAARLLGIENAA